MRDLLQAADPGLVDCLVVPATLHDVTGRFVHINPAAERASGKLDAELVGREITHLLPPEVHANVRAQFRRAVERGEPTDFETAFIDAGGQLRGVRVQHLPLRDADTIVGVLTLAFEVRRPPAEIIGLGPEPRLTLRQRQILELIAAGLSTAEVAKELTLSTETVRNHLRNASSELRAHSRVEAIATAERLGLLAAPALGPPPDADVVPYSRGDDRPASRRSGGPQRR